MLYLKIALNKENNKHKTIKYFLKLNLDITILNLLLVILTKSLKVSYK